MSRACDAVLASLHYDSEARTAQLSSGTLGFGAVSAALEDAFGAGENVTLSEVTLLEPDVPEAASEVLLLRAGARLLGAKRDLRLEIGLVAGRVQTLLLVAPLPRDGWRLSTGWPDLPGASDLEIRGGVLVVSAGIELVREGRTVGARAIDLRDAPLRDGLQIIGTGLTRASVAELFEPWNAARDAGLPAAWLPDRRNPANAVEVRPSGRALQVDAWWASPGGVEGLGTGAKRLSSGLGVRLRAEAADARSYSWLWEIDVGADDALVLRAEVTDGAPLRFVTEQARPLALGARAGAVGALLGDAAGALLSEMPESLALVSLEYTHGAHISATLVAGSDAGGDGWLLKLGPLQLRQVSFGFDLSLPDRTCRLELGALVEIFGVDFRARYEPDVLLSAELADPVGIPLGALVERAFGVDLPFGLDTLVLQDAWVRVRLELGLHSVGLSLGGAVDLLPGAIRLDQIGLELDQDGPDQRDIRIFAQLTLGPVSLRVLAERDGDAGWCFEGRASSAGVSFTALIDHLAHSLGVAVPDEVPDVSLRALLVRYHVGTRTLRIEGETTWSFAAGVPVVAGAHEVVLSLEVAPDRTTGGRSATMSMRWRFERGGRSYDASALLSRAQRRLEIDLDAGASPVGLDAALSALGLSGGYPGQGMLGGLFQARTLSLTWVSGGALDFAFSRALGNGTLLLELDTGAGRFDASWVPEAAGSTVGIRDVLDVVECGAALDELDGALSGVGLGGMVQGVTRLLTFQKLGFRVDRGATGGVELMAVPVSATLAACFVSVPSGGGLLVGLSFQDGVSLAELLRSDLPFLGNELGNFFDSMNSQVQFQPRLALISTTDRAGVVPPAFDEAALQPAFQRTAGSVSRRPFSATPARVTKGLALAGRVVFPNGSLARKHLGIQELNGVVALGSVLSLQAALGGTLRLDGGADGGLSLTDPSLKLLLGTAGPGLELGGSVDLLLFGQHIRAHGSLAMIDNAISGRVELETLPPVRLPGLPGVHVVATAKDPFCLEIAQKLVPPALDLGLKGNFYIGKDPAKYRGAATLVMELVEEVPNPLYVKLDIDQIDLYALGEALTGIESATHEVALVAGVAGGDVGAAAGAATHALEGALQHLQSALSSVSFDHVSIYWADGIVPLPDGSSASPGVGIRGHARIFDWDAYAQLEVTSGALPGISGHLELEPLDIGGVLSLKGDGKGIRVVPAKGQDVKLEPPVSAGESTARWFIAPGGPVFHVSSRQAPFLHASLHASLFGFLHADITADIDETGLDFDMKLGAGEALQLDLRCLIDAKQGLAAHGRLQFKLNGDIGPILPGIDATRFHLDVGMVGEVDLEVSAEQFRLAVRGGFEFMGAHLTVPELVLTVRFASLAALGELIWDHIKSLAHDIFEDVLMPVGKFLEDAGKAVAAVAVEAAHAVEEVATAAAVEVSRAAEEVGAALTTAGQDLTHTAEEVAAQATAVWNGAAAAADAAAKDILDNVATIRTAAKRIASESAAAVTAVTTAVASEVTRVTAAMADMASKAWDTAKDTLDRALVAVAHLLEDAAALAGQLSAAADAAVAATMRMVADVEAEISQIAAEINRILEEALAALRAVGGAFEDAGEAVGDALTSW